MQAVLLLGPGQLSCQEIPIPRPRAEEVVLKIDAALTCGTDLKAFRRGHPKWPTPTRFGHEYAGTIAARGAKVTSVREGDAVMLAPTAPCGSCFYCQRDQETLCVSLMETMVLGGYAEYLAIPARVIRTNLFPKPTRLPFAEAALLEPLSCVVYGLQQPTLRPDDTVVIIGAGAFGLLHLVVLRALGVEQVYVIARNLRRAKIAQELGAYGIIPCAAEEARPAVLDVTAGRGADLVIECTAQPRVWEEALCLARPGGQVVLFGGCPPGTTVSLDTYRLHYDQVRVFSPFHFTPKAVRQAYELLTAGKIPAEKLISGSYPLAQLPYAFDLLQRGEGIKYAVIP
ncbi:MAG: alcohol dehydrogenase catalytic domain-containing protein [Deltaproteobacteria bacterium]|nr:alcohol dehydrogenase catalytic domain-containing protein [Deltaproteobacteria bacterium]